MHTIGWREWISFPELEIPALKAKIDTGARTSALHAFKLVYFTEDNIHKVRFYIHPRQRRSSPVIKCIAPLKEMRWVTDSGGHREQRPVIETLIKIGDLTWPIESTLTSRDDMRFRMLLGRTGMRAKQLMINPAASYLFGKSGKQVNS
jgi:hypothetical protein